MISTDNPIVFLHIPKTAGQTIHNRLVKLVGGPEYVSPIRVHIQAGDCDQMPAGYRLYSGHLDWTQLDKLPKDRFAFTVLRDPKERIASFYFYLIKDAHALSSEELAQPINLGMRKALEETPDEYFFGGDAQWQKFILDHYDNFYCSYFASRLMRGRKILAGLDNDEIHQRAMAGLSDLQGVYFTDRLDLLEADIRRNFGAKIALTRIFVNAGDHEAGAKRWPKLAAAMESDRNLARLESFAERDEALIADLKSRLSS
ncbi:sulfotransferase family 2 domain-containing protein [Paracoccus aerodenitrificans]|uniref:sulfotransferase family 2 domain-containing protein n=1 Tax=Paracoccus aerodenitrificans TaxID=3017781 RepID=UPI0022EFF43B|nr:sulfotransferase family 2 domain-containing protein [Paracoccus aerodenitrificans]WBU63885.1 sulfotransferase family 2 domain-containing protein [Paracoccus aerodenitrificans]